MNTLATAARAFLAAILTFTFSTSASASARRVDESQPATTSQIERRVSANPGLAVQRSHSEYRDAVAASDAAGQVRALRVLVQAHLAAEAHGEAARYAAIGLPLARSAGKADAHAEFLFAAGSAKVLSGQVVPGLADLDQANALAQQHRLADLEGRILVRRAMAHSIAGRHAAALESTRAAYELLQSIDDRRGMALSLGLLAYLTRTHQTGPDDLRRSADYLRKSLDLVDEEVYRNDAATTAQNLGVVYLELGERVHAREQLEHSLRLAREVRNPLLEKGAHFRLGVLDDQEGHYLSASEHLKLAMPTSGEPLPPVRLMSIQLASAQAAAGAHDVAEAERLLEQAAGTLKQLPATVFAVEYHQAAAKVMARLGRFEAGFAAMQRLRDAEKAKEAANNKKVVEELKMGLHSQLQDAENRLLREKARANQLTTVALVLGILLCLLSALLLAYYLRAQTREKRRFAKLAMEDALTGLPNRRSILEHAEDVVAGSAPASAKGCCVAVLDIDHFKRINDTLGHDVGDLVLQRFAATCQSMVRAGDAIGRLGGEEFLLVIADASAQDIAQVHPRLREGIQRLQMPELGDLPLSFSMGVARRLQPADTVHDLVKRADEALYEAKRSGRDRCVVYGDMERAGDERLQCAVGGLPLPDAVPGQ
jgi:diguanylate cyclase (GGDEF)-like protein